MNFRPKLSLWGHEDMERIISSAYDLLATMGVKINHAEALKILGDHGAVVDFSARVARIPQGLIEKSLDTAPSLLGFYNFAGDERLGLAGDTVHFVLDSAPVYLLDSGTKKPSLSRPMKHRISMPTHLMK